MKKTLGIFLFCLLTLAVSSQALPELAGRVVDIPGVLSQTQKNNIEIILERYELATDHQMVVAIIPSLEGAVLEEYSIMLAEKWKIGREGHDDGVIILVALNDRKIRIEVGYGLEGEITDLQAWKTINDIIRPNFQSNDYYKGLLLAVLHLSKLTGADESTFKDTKIIPKKSIIGDYKSITKNPAKLIPFLILAYLLGFGVRFFFKMIYQEVGGVIPKIIFGLLILISIVSIIAVFILLKVLVSTFIIAFGFGVLGIRTVAGLSGGYSGSSGGSFGGGGGGFSGGGGSFGGGGASGSW